MQDNWGWKIIKIIILKAKCKSSDRNIYFTKMDLGNIIKETWITFYMDMKNIILNNNDTF